MGFLRVRGRSGYFFVVDSILAAVVLLLGIFILYSTSIRAPVTEPQFARAESFALTLNDPNAALSNSYYQSVLLPQNYVPFADASPIEEIGYLMFRYQQTGDPTYRTHAQTYTESLMNDSLETFQGSSIMINRTLVYNRSIAQNEFFLNRSLIIYVRMNSTTLYGPMIAEVHLWR